MNRFLIPIIGLVTMLFSCAPKTSDIFAEGELRLTKTKLVFKIEATSSIIQVGGSNNWKTDVTNLAEWCTVEEIHDHEFNDFIKISVTENSGIYDRQTTFEIVSRLDKKTITIAQLGNNPGVLVNKDRVLYRSSTQTVVEFDLVSNIEFIMTSTSDWLTIDKGYVNDDTPIKIGLTKNTTGAERKASIVFTQVGGEYKDSVQFIQSDKIIDYEQGDITKLDGNKKLMVIGATSSSFIDGKPISMSFDGDVLTYFQSQWQKITEPVVLEYDFDGADGVDYFVYTPYPQDPSKLFGQTKVYTKSRGEEYVLRKTHNFSGEKTQTVMFDGQIPNVEKIKFEVIKSSDTAEKELIVVACSEMEFYVSAMQYPEIFTDRSYSKLKQNVTLNQILGMEDEFFRNIAEYLFSGSYSEFRIQEYEAYPNPTAAKYVTKQPSMLDNATGIWVKAATSIVVMVDNLKGQVAQLVMMRPGMSVITQKTVDLTDGITKIDITEDALLYVRYFTPNYATVEPIKVHIAGGEVCGYYDTKKHTEAQGMESLSKTQMPYFDLRGEHVQLILPTQALRESCASLKALIEKYDRIVELQKEFIGMTKYNLAPKNRICITSVPNISNEDIANAVVLNEMFINSYVNQDKLKGDVLWDVTSAISRAFVVNCLKWNPSFRDANTVYVTNELEGTHRYITNEIYSLAAKRFIISYLPIASTTELTAPERSVPLWQLYLYMSKTKGKHDFLKDLFKKLDTANSATQASFVKEVNLSAQIDFRQFFKDWCFANYTSAGVLPTKAPEQLKFITEENALVFNSIAPATAASCEYYKDVISSSTGQKNVFVMNVRNSFNVVGYEVITNGILSMHYSDKFYIDFFNLATKVTAIGVNGERINLNCTLITKPKS